MSRDTKGISADLIKIYREKFGGKKNMRFKISQERLRDISARVPIRDAFKNKLRNELLKKGFVFIENREGKDVYFIIISSKVFTNYREVPARLIRKYQEAANV